MASGGAAPRPRYDAAGTSVDLVLSALERTEPRAPVPDAVALESLRASIRNAHAALPGSATAGSGPAAADAAAARAAMEHGAGMTLRSRTAVTIPSVAPSPTTTPSPPTSPTDPVVVSVAPGCLYYAELNRSAQLTPADCEIWLPMEPSLLYINFANDFGPIGLGRLYRFCTTLHQVLQMVYHKLTATAAFMPFRQSSLNFVPFCDAGGMMSLFDLTIPDCLAGLAKGIALGWIDFDRFDVDEYEHFEQVEHGDWNWIVPGKFLACATPQGLDPAEDELAPSYYIPHFKRMGITAVVRLNNACYEADDFRNAGIEHHDMFFPDGHNPPDDILERFLELARRSKGALAVHCKAGLGRTGTLICAYLIRYHGFSAAEAIGYCRIWRPGSVVGPQQNYLCSMEPFLQGRSPSPSPTNSPTSGMQTGAMRQPRKTRDGRSITVQITDAP